MDFVMEEGIINFWVDKTENCQIIKKNWQVPNFKLDNVKLEEIENILNQSKKFFEANYNYIIFEEFKNTKEILKKNKTNIIGSYKNYINDTFMGLDYDFNKTGTNYGPKNKTIKTILEKNISTLISIYSFLKPEECKLFFISPSIDDCIYDKLNECNNEFNNFLKTLNLNYKINIICNKNFEEDFFLPFLKEDNYFDQIEKENFINTYNTLK